MPSNKNFSIRIEILDECFRNRNRNWTLSALVTQVNEKLKAKFGINVNKRTVQNDIRHMIDEMSAPIEKVRKNGQILFVYTDYTYSIKNQPIKAEEVCYLTDAINILRQVNDFGIVSVVDSIISKFRSDSNEKRLHEVPIIQFERHVLERGIAYIDDLYVAIKEKRALRISYRSFKAKDAKHFTFFPYLLKEYRNRWFLFGSQEGSTDIVNLALDRIEGIKNSNTEFVGNEQFDPREYFKWILGVSMPRSPEVEEFVLKISPTLAPYVLSKPIHSSQKTIKRYKNGSVLIMLPLIWNYEFQSTLLGFGVDVEIKLPLARRLAIKESLRKAHNLYL